MLIQQKSLVITAPKTTELMLFIVRMVEAGNKLIHEKHMPLEKLKEKFKNQSEALEILDNSEDIYFEFELELKSDNEFVDDLINKSRINSFHNFSMN